MCTSFFFRFVRFERKSKENNDKVSSNYDQMSDSSKNNNKNDILTVNDDNKTKKNKNQEKNEIKYLSDDDLDEIFKE